MVIILLNAYILIKCELQSLLSTTVVYILKYYCCVSMCVFKCGSVWECVEVRGQLWGVSSVLLSGIKPKSAGLHNKHLCSLRCLTLLESVIYHMGLQFKFCFPCQFILKEIFQFGNRLSMPGKTFWEGGRNMTSVYISVLSTRGP